MLFKRRPKEEIAHQEQPPGDQADTLAAAGPQAVLRDEVGLHHLWYLELRLREELARAARVDGVFSLAAWRMRLLPGETADPDVIARCVALIVQALRSYDIVARVDEMRIAGLLLDADYQSASTVAHRIKADLQTRVPTAGRWQAGVATFGRDGVDGDSLIQAAFRRLEEDARAA